MVKCLRLNIFTPFMWLSRNTNLVNFQQRAKMKGKMYTYSVVDNHSNCAHSENSLQLLLLLLLLLSLLLIFIQSVYNYIPETKLVSRIYSVATLLQLQIIVLVKLFPIFIVLCFDIKTFRST